MKKTITALLGVLGLAAVATTAGAAVYPPGPSGTCLDSVQVSDIQNLAATCHPATADTVYGVSGIITGFDTFPTGYAMYVQSRRSGANGAPWTGVDVFTGGDNLVPVLGLARGDSVHVRGRTEEYQGETEITAFNGAFGNNKISIEKYSAGNSLPAFHVGTVAELQELPTNPFAEQWEGCLVRVPSVTRVARTVNVGTFSSFIVVDDILCPTSSPGPCDSMFIDGSTLSFSAVSPPPVGTKIQTVQGIYNQRTRGYRIQLRDANDIEAATAPSLADAYPVHDDTLRVIFDKNVTTASAESTAYYSLGSFGTILSATKVEPNVVHLAISNGLAHGDNESVSAVGIAAESNGLRIETPSSRSFFNGVMSTAEVQAPDPIALGGAPCEDRSRFAGAGSAPGQRLTYRGVLTGLMGSVYYLEDANAAVRGGLGSYAPIAPLTNGRQYMWVGTVQEYFGETEGVGNVYLRDEGAPGIPNPIVQTVAVLRDSTCDAGQSLTTAEDYEGMLVKVSYVRIVEERTAGQSFYVAGPSPTYPDTMLISIGELIPVTFDPDSAHTVDVTGILRWSFGQFRIYPRTNADIVDHGLNVGVGPNAPASRLSFAVYPNPAKNARLSFTLPRAGDVDLSVYDLAGRKLATIVKGQLPAGEFSKAWNGLDDAGRKMGAGIYFYRLQFENEKLTKSGVLLQ